MDSQKEKKTDIQSDGQIGRQTHGLRDIQGIKQSDTQTGRHSNRQTDRCTCIHCQLDRHKSEKCQSAH